MCAAGALLGLCRAHVSTRLRADGGASTVHTYSEVRISLVIAVMILLPAVGSAQTPQTAQTPPAPPATQEVPVFRVQIWGDAGTDFGSRVSSYAELRGALEQRLPRLTVTDDPAEILRAIRALAKKIQAARAGAKEGDIFSPTVRAEFRKALSLKIDASTWAVIMDENPGTIDVPINGSYPLRKTVTTMPPNVLAALPKLPPDMEYRFLGRHLVLVDTRASVIIDRIPYALRRAPRRP